MYGKRTQAANVTYIFNLIIAWETLATFLEVVLQDTRPQFSTRRRCTPFFWLCLVLLV
jgi:hypothetical protein